MKIVWIEGDGDPNNIKWSQEYILEDLLKETHKEVSYYPDSLTTYSNLNIDKSLVVYSSDDRVLNKNLLNLLKTSYDLGQVFNLCQFSNEQLRHDYSYYKLANHTFRCYYGPEFHNDSTVTILPIGYQSGFKSEKPPLKFKDKVYSCNFVGQPKNERYQMLEEMSKLDDTFIHTTTRWNCPSWLSQKDMSEIMSKSLVTPMPRGNVHIECHRFYECLESGGIPLIKTYNGFNYYDFLLGKSPLPSIENWSDLGLIIKKLTDESFYNSLVDETHAWYGNVKKTIANKLTERAQNLETS